MSTTKNSQVKSSQCFLEEERNGYHIKLSYYSPGFKEKDSATLEESLKICIQGQFFVLKKTRWGTRLIF